MGRYETFVVRLWTDGSEELVRGHVQHVATRRGVYFRDAVKMLEFIGEYLGDASPAWTSGIAAPADAGEAALPAAEGGRPDDR